MTNDSSQSIKHDYVSQDQMASKAQEWMSDIKGYMKKGERFKFVPSSSALLVMDMQGFFLSEESHAFIPSSKAIVPNIGQLISAYRESNLPVIFTRHSLKDDEDPGIMGRWWGDIIRESSALSEIVPSLRPLSSEIVIRKTRYSAFYGTELESILKQMNIKSTVIAGVMTHLCCESTAREAFIRDYEVFFVVDATATQNEELHLSSLRALSHGFSVPITTNEILAELKGM